MNYLALYLLQAMYLIVVIAIAFQLRPRVIGLHINTLLVLKPANIGTPQHVNYFLTPCSMTLISATARELTPHLLLNNNEAWFTLLA